MTQRRLMLDRILKRLCLAGIASFALAISAGAQQISTPNSSELNYNSTYCLPTQSLQGFTQLSIFGNSFDIANQSTGATVKWTVWKGPAFDNPTMTRIYSAQGTSVGTVAVQNTDTSNPWTQACIANTIPPSGGGTRNTALFYPPPTPPPTLTFPFPTP